MFKAFNQSIAALVLGATLAGGVAAPAMARDRDDRRDYRDGRKDDRRDYRADRRDDRRDYRRDQRDYRRDNRRPDRVVVVRDRRAPRVVYAYDYNRPDPRYRGYYANNYYRSYDRYGYEPVRVTRNTRIYRGNDDRYYCRRSDGTTGLIIGAAIGGVLGDRIDRGNSSILGAVLGAAGGGLIGRELDRGEVVCR